MTRGLILALALMASPALAHAADWRHPYANIDHRVDAGNNTGDWEVPALNAAQLNRAGVTSRRAWPRDRFAGAATVYPPAIYPSPIYPPAYYPPPLTPWPAPPYPYPVVY
jgi:hypothetical protein